MFGLSFLGFWSMVWMLVEVIWKDCIGFKWNLDLRDNSWVLYVWVWVY